MKWVMGGWIVAGDLAFMPRLIDYLSRVNLTLCEITHFLNSVWFNQFISFHAFNFIHLVEYMRVEGEIGKERC